MAKNKLLSRYDVLIIGSGIAGMLLALELDRAGMRTALVCKGNLLDSNTSWAQGGVAICTGANPQDDKKKHLEDTLAAGAGLSDEFISSLIIEGGLELFEKLEKLGLAFDRKDGRLELAREGGHCVSRVLHSKDATGKAIAETLAAAVRSAKRLAVFENMFAIDLITHNGRCVGLRVLQDEKAVDILAGRVVLATGGPGQVFSRTTNPALATGDGIAMAYRAGAELVDLEFVQFHPTALYLPGAPASLISEAVRGSGAHLLDKNGRRFAFRFHKDGELATRDLVSRAIMTVMHEQDTPCVHLDMRPLGAALILDKYPNIVQACRSWGIDPLERPIPVSPAAHYFMGGIWTDENGRSSLPGLYAIGECACTGLHGANRLASNSLLEGGVMALRAARAIQAESPVRLPASISVEDSFMMSASGFAAHNIDELKVLMFKNAGISRDGSELSGFIEYICKHPARFIPFEQREIEAANLSLLSSLIVASALARSESRGAHFRRDFPARNDERFSGHYFVSKDSKRWQLDHASRYAPLKEQIQ